MEIGIAVQNRRWLQQFTRNAILENDWQVLPVFYRLKADWNDEPAISCLYYPPVWVWNSEQGLFVNPFRRDFPESESIVGIWIFLTTSVTESERRGFNVKISPDRNIGKFVVVKSPDEPRIVGCKLTHILSEVDMNYLSSGEADNVLQLQPQ